MIEEFADRLDQLGGGPGFAAGCLGEPLPDGRLGEMKYQIVGPQAGNIARRIKARERVVKIVGEKHLLQPALVEDLLLPIGRGHFLRGRVVERLPVVLRDPFLVKIEERASTSPEAN